MERDPNEQLEEYVLQYCDLNELTIKPTDRLGFGLDGTVWESSQGTALKAFYREVNYRNELECYRRLEGAARICDLAVPQLLGNDDDLMVIEMTIVQPPFLLDFAKVYFDAPPDYWHDEQAQANQHDKGVDEFGPRWPIVQNVLAALVAKGIYYVDPRPANIRFENDPGDPSQFSS